VGTAFFATAAAAGISKTKSNSEVTCVRRWNRVEKRCIAVIAGGSIEELWQKNTEKKQ
jgi:hypothetical protein